jgi:type IV fimbrial biogenesis protein FimT
MNNQGRSRQIPGQAQRGLTVVEILIGLSFLLFILLISTPVVSNLAQKYELKQASDTMVESLELAQFEEGRRYSTVRVCPSTHGTGCRKDGNWNKGWLVYTDGNNNQEPDRIEILQFYERPHPDVKVIASGAFSHMASFTVGGPVGDGESDSGMFEICHRGISSRRNTISVDPDGHLGVGQNNKPCNFR